MYLAEGKGVAMPCLESCSKYTGSEMATYLLDMLDYLKYLHIYFYMKILILSH